MVRCIECGMLGRPDDERGLLEISSKNRICNTSLPSSWNNPVCCCSVVDFQEIGKNGKDAVTSEFSKDRGECKSFSAYIPGLTPKEHREMNFLEQREKLMEQREKMIEQSRMDFESMMQQRDQDFHKALADERKNWDSKFEKSKIKYQILVSVVSAVIATILTMLIGKIVQNEPKQPEIKIIIPPTQQQKLEKDG